MDFSDNFFFVVSIKYRILVLEEELMCRYFHGIVRKRRDPNVFFQCDEYLLNESFIGKLIFQLNQVLDHNQMNFYIRNILLI